MRNRLLSSVAVASLAGAFALGMAASAMAQTSPSPSSPSAPATRSTPPAAAPSTSPSSSDQRSSPADLGGMSAAKLMGKTVYNSEGKKVGDINDLVVKGGPSSGAASSSPSGASPSTTSPSTSGAGSTAGTSGAPKEVTYAVIGVGGFLGLGEKDVVIPANELQVTGDRVQLSSNITEDQLKQMPKYDKSQYRSVARDNSGTSGTSTAPRSDTPARSTTPPASSPPSGSSTSPSGSSAPSGTSR
jgi:hypothetical protein